MDPAQVNAVVELIRDSHKFDSSLGVYVHNIQDALPPLSHAYSDPLTVCSSVVLRLECGSYVFISDLKSGPRIPHVRMYCSSLVQFMFPLSDKLQQFFKHFFPCKHTLDVYECSDHCSLDKNGSVQALLNLYSCIITDRSLKFNILKSQKVLDGIVASFCTSLTSKVLARYSDQLFYSVEEVRPDKSYSVMICSAEQVLQNRKELGMKLAQLDQSRKRSVETSVDSDEDFEQAPKSKRKKSKRTSDLPKFSNYSKILVFPLLSNLFQPWLTLLPLLEIFTIVYL